MNVKKKFPKFDVTEDKNPEFVSTTAFEKTITNRKNGTERVCFGYLDIRWLSENIEGVLPPWETLHENQPFLKINFKKRVRGRKLPSLRHVNQNTWYAGRRNIAFAKKKDMNYLLL